MHLPVLAKLKKRPGLGNAKPGGDGGRDAFGPVGFEQARQADVLAYVMVSPSGRVARTV